MPFIVNHIHLKSLDPKAMADWFVEAFKVEIVSDNVRPVGDRFIATRTEGGLTINISSERTGETLGPADANPTTVSSISGLTPTIWMPISSGCRVLAQS